MDSKAQQLLEQLNESQLPKLRSSENVGGDKVFEGEYQGVKFLVTSEPKFNRKTDGVKPKNEAKLWASKVPDIKNDQFEFTFDTKKQAVKEAMRKIDFRKNKGML